MGTTVDAGRSSSDISEPAVDAPQKERDATLTKLQSNHAPEDAHFKRQRRYVTAAMMMVMVLASMEQTVTSTAMPTIVGDLNGLEHYSWVVSIYLLACTISMPLYGRLADALGRKKVILFAIALFCVASVLASASHSMFELILFRGLQGLGAGGIMPVVLTILGDIFTLKERAAVQGFFSFIWGSASIAGPVLGAFLVKTMGWRSIFFVNLPFAALSFVVLVWKYHDREKPHSTDLDLPGVTLLAIACTAVLAVVSPMGRDGWPLPAIIGLVAVAIATTLCFIKVERSAANPILPPDLFAKRAIGPSMIASGLLGIGFLSMDTYVPLYVQGAKGGGAAAAGWAVTPVMLTWALSGLFAAPMIIRLGFRKTATFGCILTLVSFSGLVACAFADAPRWAVTGVLLISGLGFGPASMSYLLASQEAVAWQQRGIITSGIQFFRTIGGAIGIGLMGMLFNRLIAPDLARLHDAGINPSDLMDPIRRGQLNPTALHTASRMIGHGLTWVFAAMLIFAAMQVVVTLLLPNRKADHAISRVEAMEAIAG
ncbi:MAG TPA: MFS transporter [Humisphaera sp.]|nr:MFS transporter [Humisphaera sp.]